MCSDRKQIIGCLRTVERELGGRVYQGVQENLGGVINMSIILIVVFVLQVYTYIKFVYCNCLPIMP